jgi:hypothetical protein
LIGITFVEPSCCDEGFFYGGFLPLGNPKKGAITYPKELYLEKSPKVTTFGGKKS